MMTDREKLDSVGLEILAFTFSQIFHHPAECTLQESTSMLLCLLYLPRSCSGSPETVAIIL